VVRLILIFAFITSAHADIFGFGTEKTFKSRIPQLTEKLKKLPLKTDPGFEDTFNQVVKAVENGIEEEKLYCGGEAPDAEGKILPADQKQLCFRELKKNYLEAVEVIFEAKKNYLQLLHNEQQNRLTEVHRKLKADIDKNF
jgi:hypothetical protein